MAAPRQQSFVSLHVESARTFLLEIQAEVHVLQSFSGFDKKFALRSIDWESDAVYSNGLRSPPWRQSHNEVGYVAIVTADAGKIFVACKLGPPPSVSEEEVPHPSRCFAVITGYETHGPGGRDKLNYEPLNAEETFPSIVELLTAYSPHFASISKSSFIASQVNDLLAKLKATGSLDIFRSDSVASVPISETPAPVSVPTLRSVEFSAASSVSSPLAKSSPAVASSSSKKDKISIAQVSSDGEDSSPEVGTPRRKQQPPVAALSKQNSTPLSPRRNGAVQPKEGHSTPRAKDGKDAVVIPQNAESLSQKLNSMSLSDRWSNILPMSPQGLTTSVALDLERVKANSTATGQAVPPSQVSISASVSNVARLIPQPPPGSPRTAAPSASSVAVSELSASGRPRSFVKVSKKPLEEEDSEQEGGGEEHVHLAMHGKSGDESTPETQLVHKMVALLKGRNLSTNILALFALRECNLRDPANQLAIIDDKGEDPLLGLLSVRDPLLLIVTAFILREISFSARVVMRLMEASAMGPLVNALDQPVVEARALIAEVIANCCENHTLRRILRRSFGLRKLVDLLGGKTVEAAADLAVTSPGLSASSSRFSASLMSPPGKEPPKVDPTASVSDDLARALCRAFAIAGRSNVNRKLLKQYGVIPLISRLLTRKDEKMLLEVARALTELCAEPDARKEFRENSGLENLVEQMNNQKGNADLIAALASATYVLAQDKEAREGFNKLGGMNALAFQLSFGHPAVQEKSAAATFRMTEYVPNSKALQDGGAVAKLVSLVQANVSDTIKMYAAGALANCGKVEASLSAIRGCVGSLVRIISTSINASLLVPVCDVIAVAAADGASLKTIHDMEGIRLLWSLLKNKDEGVQSSAAVAIARCLDVESTAEEVGRSLIQGFPLLISLLGSPSEQVQSSVCQAVARLCIHEANIGVLTEQNLLPSLARLVNTTNDSLRKSLTLAIAQSCVYRSNRETLLQLGAVVPLVDFLHGNDADVHRNTATAFKFLSDNDDICHVLRAANTVQRLVELLASDDEVLQDACAHAISHIRAAHLRKIPIKSQ